MKPEGSIRDIGADEILPFYRDGASVLREVVSVEWIEAMRMAVDRLLAAKSEFSFDHQQRSKPGRFRDDLFLWRREPEFEAFVRASPLPALAARVLGSRTVRLFYDQLLVKEPGTAQPTPWHQDLPYWPIRGAQILSIWIPFDAATVENGVVQYLAGSHLWGRSFAPRAFGADRGGRFEQHVASSELEPVPEADIERGDHRVVTWDVEPGDVILHHPLTLHYATGNGSVDRRRRALSIRYAGDDVRWAEKRGTFLGSREFAPLRPLIGLREGDPLSGELFPRVWP